MTRNEKDIFGLGELPADAINQLNPVLKSTSFIDVLTELNTMVKLGEISDYAIGGGYASIYHGVPYFTEDVDVLVLLSGDDDFSKLFDPQKIFRYFERKGYVISKDYVYISNTPVQFFPNISPLFNEAIKEAERIEVQGVSGKVVNLEYLIVLLLTSFRPKDKIKITEFCNNANMPKIHEILRRFDNGEQKLSKRLEEVLGKS